MSFPQTRLPDPTLKQQISIWMCIQMLSNVFSDYQNDVNLTIEKYQDPTPHTDVHSSVFWMASWIIETMSHPRLKSTKILHHTRMYIQTFSDGLSDYQHDGNLTIEKYQDSTPHTDVHSNVFGWLLKLLK